LLKNGKWNDEIKELLKKKLSRQRSLYTKARTLSGKAGRLFYYSHGDQKKIK